MLKLDEITVAERRQYTRVKVKEISWSHPYILIADDNPEVIIQLIQSIKDDKTFASSKYKGISFLQENAKCNFSTHASSYGNKDEWINPHEFCLAVTKDAKFFNKARTKGSDPDIFIIKDILGTVFEKRKHCGLNNVRIASFQRK